MGKSGKKNKSDRINALRKQYDAFLDEDKKRKDRNDFILCHLEKMRLYTPALLPARHHLGNPLISKYNIVNQERPEYLRKTRFEDSSMLRSRQTDVLLDCALKDEQRILHDISKKYILIPKLRSTNGNSVTYYNPPSVSNDVDWRNKYNILDELKKFEKEGSSEVSRDTDITYGTFNNGERNDLHLKTIAAENLSEQKLNFKDPINIIRHNNENGLVPEVQTKNTKTVLTNDPDKNIDCKPPLENSQQDLILNTVKNANFENENISTKLDPVSPEQRISDNIKVNEEFYPSVVNMKEGQENKNAQLIYNQPEDIIEKEMEVVDIIATNLELNGKNIINTKNETVIQNNTVELSNDKIVDSNITGPSIEKENIDTNLYTGEAVAYPVENIGDQDPSIVQNEPASENVQQKVYDPNSESTILSNNDIPLQIDEFESEQKGMFYSEQTGYNQNDDINTQNEQYSFYNEPQQEQPYYSEINEHEESTERYDPNYEQQYVENYEENVNVAHYENQPYVEATYENQQEVTNVNYEELPHQLETSNVNYEQQPGLQEITNTNYEQQLDQQEITNVNYEQQPDQQGLTYEPFTYEYEQSVHHDNTDLSQIENINTHDSQGSEVVNYETQQYGELGEVEHPAIPDQSIYDNQQDYVQMHTEQEAIPTLEQQLDGEEGYTETPNTYQSGHVAAVENSNKIEPEVQVS